MPLASKAGVSVRPEAWGLLQVAAVRGLPFPFFCLEMPMSARDSHLSVDEATWLFLRGNLVDSNRAGQDMASKGDGVLLGFA